MSDEATVEGTGETVGEAKWSALRELEKRFPGLDRQSVEFQVLSEGERGLMGIGREPARVVATLGATPSPEQRAAVAERRPASPPRPPSRAGSVSVRPSTSVRLTRPSRRRCRAASSVS